MIFIDKQNTKNHAYTKRNTKQGTSPGMLACKVEYHRVPRQSTYMETHHIEIYPIESEMPKGEENT